MQLDTHLMPKSANSSMQPIIILNTQVKSHTRGRPYNKQLRGVTNRLKHSQPHHSAKNSKRKGKSNGRQSHQTTTTSCRDRSPNPRKCNRISEDINDLSHLDTHSFDISTVTLEPKLSQQYRQCRFTISSGPSSASI